jgi:hypothetical protein
MEKSKNALTSMNMRALVWSKNLLEKNLDALTPPRLSALIAQPCAFILLYSIFAAEYGLTHAFEYSEGLSPFPLLYLALNASFFMNSLRVPEEC